MTESLSSLCKSRHFWNGKISGKFRVTGVSPAFSKRNGKIIINKKSRGSEVYGKRFSVSTTGKFRVKNVSY